MLSEKSFSIIQNDNGKYCVDEHGVILDYIRITPLTENLRSICSPGWIYIPATGFLHRMNCKRRNCDDCGWFWAWRWRKALAEKARSDLDLGRLSADKALTLTFAENVHFEIMQRILEDFWLLLRRAYPGIEYWGVVEFNQKHTIPHLHFILSNCPYLELDYLDFCWKAAQKRAKLEHLAWNLRIEKIRKNTQAYFTKYVLKLVGGKDEIPRRENWQGRFVRYSRKFFPVPVQAMLLGRMFQEKLEANDDLDRIYWHVHSPLAGLSGFMEAADKEEQKLFGIVNNAWDYIGDKNRATPLKEPDLFDGIDTIPVFFTPTFDREQYKILEGYNYSSSDRLGPAF